MHNSLSQWIGYFLCIAIYVLSYIGFFSGNAFGDYSTISNKDEVVLLSDDQEIAIGKRLSRSAEKQYKLVEDEKLQDRVNKIGQKIAAVSERKYLVYYFKVLKGEDVNAFSLPGGYVYLFEGLIKKVKTDDEIAAVIAHEVGHISCRHNIKRLQGSLGSNLLMVLSALSPTDNSTRANSSQAITELMLEYSREDEIQADRLSVKYLKSSGYNPEAIVTFLTTLKEIMEKAPIRPYRPYKTHPYLSQRIAIVRQAIRGKMDFTDYINMPEDK